MHKETEFLPDLRTRAGDCSCGKRHELYTQEVCLAQGAKARLPAILTAHFGPGAHLFLVADTNTHRVAGEEVATLLKDGGFSLRELVLPGEHLHVSEELAAAIMADHPEEAVCLVAVGSGSITDLVRLVGHRLGRPFVAVPTAASMDGYTSPVVPMVREGIKQATPATPPLAVVADLEFVASAPARMALAGFGDLVGKITARADWILAALLGGEDFCRYLADLSVTALEKACREPDEIRTGSFAALTALMEGLLLSGLAMQMAGSSRPASGAEHHLAHYWEERDLLAGRERALHGTYVGLATPFVAAVLHRLAALTPEEVAGRLLSSQGEIPPLRVERWEEVQRMVRELVPPPTVIRQMLAAAGAPATPSAVGLEPTEVLAALLHAHEGRARFTSLTLAHRLGLMAEWGPALVTALT